MNSDSDFARGDIGNRALVAAFPGRESAHGAAKRLREEGFHKIWIGVIRGDAGIKSDDDSLGAKVVRLFSGEGDGRSLTGTLTHHGVAPEDAQRIEGLLVPDDVILTVNGSNHPELAARLIEDAGGDIISGESSVFTAVEWSAGDDRRGSVLLGYADPTEFARGQRVDDEGLTRLRNERLLNAIVPTISEDIFFESYDDEDDATVTREHGRRSAGGAIGTQHRDDLTS